MSANLLLPQSPPKEKEEDNLLILFILRSNAGVAGVAGVDSGRYALARNEAQSDPKQRPRPPQPPRFRSSTGR